MLCIGVISQCGFLLSHNFDSVLSLGYKSNSPWLLRRGSHNFYQYIRLRVCCTTTARSRCDGLFFQCHVYCGGRGKQFPRLMRMGETSNRNPGNGSRIYCRSRPLCHGDKNLLELQLPDGWLAAVVSSGMGENFPHHYEARNPGFFGCLIDAGAGVPFCAHSATPKTENVSPLSLSQPPLSYVLCGKPGNRGLYS